MPEPGSVQVRLAPLLRAEALYLLGETSVGMVVCAQDGTTTRRPGFHVVERGAVVVLTLLTAELDALLDARQPMTYWAESVDQATGAGWRATITGPAGVLLHGPLRRHYQRLLPGFEACDGAKVIRMRPQAISGHRFQRLSAAL